MEYRYVAIEGNIGAGKSSLAKLFAEKFNGKLLLEEFEENPYLEKFYSKGKEYAFSMEFFFIADRYRQLKKFFYEPDLFQQTVFTDYYIRKSLVFAKNNLEDDEYRVFSRVFDTMFSSIPKPDLLIYLHASPESLLRNIRKRGRNMEQQITYEYLKSIEEAYFDFLKKLENIPVVLVECDALDFVENREDYTLLEGVLSQEFEVGLNRVYNRNGSFYR